VVGGADGELTLGEALVAGTAVLDAEALGAVITPRGT
jgi:hypothetical protein